jgi:hypothetical protein
MSDGREGTERPGSVPLGEHMARKITALSAACRVGEAKRIIADQYALIARLRAAGHPGLEAGRSLQIYLSALKLLEAHEKEIKTENKTKRGETRKGRAT